MSMKYCVSRTTSFREAPARVQDFRDVLEHLSGLRQQVALADDFAVLVPRDLSRYVDQVADADGLCESDLALVVGDAPSPPRPPGVSGPMRGP